MACSDVPRGIRPFASLRFDSDGGRKQYGHDPHLVCRRRSGSRAPWNGASARSIGAAQPRRSVVEPVPLLEWRECPLGTGAAAGPAASANGVWLTLFYLISVSFRMNRKELYSVLGLAMVGGITGASYAAWQFLHGAGVELSRASIGQTNPNQFALSLLLPLSIAMGAFLSMRNWIPKTAMLAAISVIGFGILISMSRGSLIAVGALILVYIRKFRMNWRLSIALLVLLALLLAVPNPFFERIQGTVADRGAGRFDIWQAGVEAAKDHSIIGVGLDNFPVAFDRYARYATVFRGYRREPHNVYLGTLTELGIVGLLLFLASIRSQIHMIEKLKAAAKQVPMVVACEGACFAILIVGLSKDILWDKVFWLSWILLSSAARLHLAEEVAL